MFTKMEDGSMAGEKEIVHVLDKGYVRLVDYMGSDLAVVRAARVSYNAEWRAGLDGGSDSRLIHYLMENRHTTPFEHVTFTFEVKAPIFVYRQWHRHRTQSYNEMSARYTEMPDEFYIPGIKTVGIQDPRNKQGRLLPLEEYDLKEVSHQIEKYEDFCKDAFVNYRSLLDYGWPRELARMVLPVSTYSKMFVTMNLWNLLHFVGLRSDQHAQYEIRVYSDAMLKLIEPIVPVCVNAWGSRG